MKGFITAHASVDEFGLHRLQWRLSEPSDVAIYLLSGAGEKRLLGTSDSADFVVNDSLPAGKHSFLLVTSDDQVVVAERRVALAGTPNLRDFGGYVTQHGASVRWGSFYRSGKLSALTADDQQRLVDAGINQIFDFRRPEEINLAPTTLNFIAQPISIDNLPIGGGGARSFNKLVMDETIAKPELLAGMKAIYRDLALAQGAVYRKIFDYLLHQDQPLLLHCTAGKDRTGVGVALILMALGVNRKTIMQDYLLTSEFYPSDIEWQEMLQHFESQPKIVDNLRYLLSVQPEFLATLFEVIDDQFDGDEHYLKAVFGFDDAELAELRHKWLANPSH
ncbi:tyrosine-protein phosphatase [Halioxenophilus sp. WMMB6]|uniref:tyrosine-protein phosphatase n=1 Tax=Halioxenophilus sp. WMMB6 TaxID=3073815 RepID=UPI00295E8181|nr:tyrosine-protein phosphatase [Halioxenophilus sp. WMMB6]